MSELKLRLGADVVQALLPHRAPLLLVDRVESITQGAEPSLRAGRAISVNEPVFQGHFPGLSLWPGIYTIEGMGQSCQLLQILLAVIEGFERAGQTAATVADVLRAMDPRARLRGVAASPFEPALRERLAAEARVAVSAAVDVRLLDPVFAGDVVEYEVRRTLVRDNIRRFEVQASVDRRPVARGTLTAAILGPPAHAP